MRHSSLVLLPALGCCVLGLWVPAATPAVAATAPCSDTSEWDVIPVVGDVNVDGRGDVVVGLPTDANLDGNPTGAVHVFLTDGTRQRVTPSSLNLYMLGGARFGSAVNLVDLDHDTCADLVIGAPGMGQVVLARGSRTGVTATGTQVLNSPTAPPGGTSTDGFGAAVAVAIREPGGVTDLWVGAPEASVAGQDRAGVVYHYAVSAEGKPSLVDTVTDQDAFGTAAAGDRFGAVLAPVAGGVAVGVPDRSVAGKTDAGQVALLWQTDGKLTHATVSQDSPGVGGSAAAGDRFGAALGSSPSGAQLLVGAPSDDLGKAKDAGSAQAFTVDGTKLTPVKWLRQGSDGVPGAAESGDHFGAAVAIGRALVCQEGGGWAVGAPGEDIGKARDAGAVTLIDDSDKPCPAKVRRQGSGLSGKPEKGDSVGASVSILRDRDDFDEDVYDDVLIGVPGENSGSGYVAKTPAPVNYGNIRGDVKGSRFGTVIGRDAIGSSF